jgi:hypothetical protein
MIYLTYNDQPSGVYSSQVIDVCRYLNSEFNLQIRLVAFISIHSFSLNRRKIQHEYPGAWVIPMLPMARWPWFSTLLFVLICLVTGARNVIARNVQATLMGLTARRFSFVKSVCMDGRGAIAAEWNEYMVVPDEHRKQAIHEEENRAVNGADHHIAVSGRLVEYWKERYQFTGERYVVIPCTLNSGFSTVSASREEIEKIRTAEGYNPNDIIAVYSGSIAGWQSFSSLENILGGWLKGGADRKLLFLSKEDDNIKKMKSRFPKQVSCRWVNHREVQSVLSACDYGILYRERTVTNRVASPTKFAEYLSAGLNVIISEDLGDYTEFVRRENCGIVVVGNSIASLPKPTSEERHRNIQLALKYFTKDAHRSNYKKVLNHFHNN